MLHVINAAPRATQPDPQAHCSPTFPADYRHLGRQAQCHAATDEHFRQNWAVL